jgi:hypothetical protein
MRAVIGVLVAMVVAVSVVVTVAVAVFVFVTIIVPVPVARTLMAGGTMIVPAAAVLGVVVAVVMRVLIRMAVRVAGMVVSVCVAVARMGWLGVGLAENRDGFWAHGCHWTAWSYYRVKHIGPGGCNENR